MIYSDIYIYIYIYIYALCLDITCGVTIPTVVVSTV